MKKIYKSVETKMHQEMDQLILLIEVDEAMEKAQERTDSTLLEVLNASFISGVEGDHDQIISDMENMFDQDAVSNQTTSSSEKKSASNVQTASSFQIVKTVIASMSHALGQSYRDFVDGMRVTPEFARGSGNRLDGASMLPSGKASATNADAEKRTIKWIPVFYDDGTVAFEDMSTEKSQKSPPELEVLIDGKDAGDRVSVDPDEKTLALVGFKPVAFTLDVLDDGTYRIDLHTS